MKRFFYNPDNENLELFNTSHVTYYHNKKLDFPFDYYIRGIIQDKILYLRAFYPFNDIDELSYNDLMLKSKKLLQGNLQGILQALKVKGLKIDNTILNVTNEELKHYLNLQYV